MKLTGSADFEAIACDANQLGQYLEFPSTITRPPATPQSLPSQAGAASVQDVSRVLCEIARTEVPGLTEAVVEQVDVVKIMEAVSETASLVIGWIAQGRQGEKGREGWAER